MTVRIVVDSAAGLSEELLQELDITEAAPVSYTHLRAQAG